MNDSKRLIEQEMLIEKLSSFSLFVIKCVRRTGEYSPASTQEMREIEVALKEYYQ